MTSSSAILLARADGAQPAFAPIGKSLGASDPFSAGREIAWSGPDAVAAGRIAFEGTGEIASFPHTELLVVLAGTLRLVQAGQPAVDLAGGTSVVIGRGTSLTVEAAPGTRLAFCATTGTGAASPGLTVIPSDAAGLKPSGAPPAELLIGPAPQCRSHNVFTEEATLFRAGLWDSTPYHRKLRPHPVSELMHLVAGAVDLTGPDGRVTRVEQGETVFIPQGAPCAWDSDVHVAKFYVVQESTASSARS